MYVTISLAAKALEIICATAFTLELWFSCWDEGGWATAKNNLHFSECVFGEPITLPGLFSCHYGPGGALMVLPVLLFRLWWERSALAYSILGKLRSPLYIKQYVFHFFYTERRGRISASLIFPLQKWSTIGVVWLETLSSEEPELVTPLTLTGDWFTFYFLFVRAGSARMWRLPCIPLLNLSTVFPSAEH